MDIPSRRLFITLLLNLYFGKTSEEMNMSPSVISLTVQRLEDQLKRPLWVRDNISAQPTEEGQMFLDYAQETVE